MIKSGYAPILCFCSMYLWLGMQSLHDFLIVIVIIINYLPPLYNTNTNIQKHVKFKSDGSPGDMATVDNKYLVNIG